MSNSRAFASVTSVRPYLLPSRHAGLLLLLLLFCSDGKKLQAFSCLWAIEACPGNVHLRTCAQTARDGCDCQLPPPWFRCYEHRAGWCRTRCSPCGEVRPLLSRHQPGRGGENIDLPGHFTRCGGRHWQILCEERNQAVSSDFL